MKNENSDAFERFCSGQPESEAVRNAVNFAKATGQYSDGSERDPVYRKWQELVFKGNPQYAEVCREAFDRHHEEIVKANMEAGEKLDEQQLFRAFCEALAAGDFVKQVVQGSGAQNFIYQPFREVTELREKYNELIYAVARRFPDETRHQTALRYINEAETKSLLECAEKINNWIGGKE